MKIKFQSGGMITYTPVFPQPLSGTTTTTSSKKSESEKIDNIIQKEIIGVLKENGIQSDVDIFLAEANEFLNKSKNLSQYSLFGGDDPKYTMSDLIAVMSMANKVKQNKEQWTNATQQLIKEEAWDEVATTTTGGIYIYDERKGLKVVSPDEYHENLEKYHGKALTNAQVLGLREQNTQLAFNTNILKDMNGAIGMKTISDQLTDIIAKFGTMSKAEFVKKTGESISQDTWDGMQTLIAEGPEGYYKVTTKSERENVQSAIKYLWDSLGTDGKKRLRAEVAVSGGDPNKNQYDLILQALEHHTDYSVDVDFDKSASEYDPDGDGSKDGPLVEETRESMIARGYGTPSTISIVPRVGKPNAKQSALTATAYNFGQLMDKDGKPLNGIKSLRDVLASDPIFAAQTDSRNITFGNIKLSSRDIDTIVVDTNWNNLSGVFLPYKESGAGFTPDFTMIEKYEKVQSVLNNNPNITNAEVHKLLIKEGIDPSKVEKVQLENGQVVWKLKTKYFLAFSAFGNDDLMSSILNNTKYFEQVGAENGGWSRSSAKNQFDVDAFNNAMTHERSIWSNDDWDYDNAWRGNIFVAIDPERAMYATGSKYLPKSLMINPLERMQISNNIQNPTYKANFE